ncbi:MAG: hypothetical protein M3R12_11030 [Actinomycetota bacterium]|nr:hypothetical protein [Actinomycetota bacterium]
MSDVEPGLDLHEWETRWSQLEEDLAEDPRGAISAACDLVDETLDLDGQDDDLGNAYRSAREVADRVERGDEVDAGDVGMAVENLRLIRNAVRPGITEEG